MNQQVDEECQIYHLKRVLQVVQARMVQQMNRQVDEECQIHHSKRVLQVVQAKTIQ
jgi:hypothetical protein